jgi:GntR family transcriptional regulator/MocR family aminotransferase
VALDPLSGFRHPSASGPAPADGLVVGYAAPADTAFTSALAALCRILPTPVT